MSAIHVLIIGSGGRELAIARAIRKSSIRHVLHFVGTYDNQGLKDMCESHMIVASNAELESTVVHFAQSVGAQLTIVGSEEALAKDITRLLYEQQQHSIEGFLGVIGPPASIAALETDKLWCRQFLAKYGMAKYSPLVLTPEGQAAIVEANPTDYVLKPRGLCGGKGVKVGGEHFHTFHEYQALVRELVEAGQNYIVEQRLHGQEFSLMTLTDGCGGCVHFPIAIDYKRAFEGDQGPNTGGMGCRTFGSQLPSWLSEAQLREAQQLNERVADYLAIEFRRAGVWSGVLFGGFMLTANGSLKLLEYNVRFGDPEAIGVLAGLDSSAVDVLDLFLRAACGRLQGIRGLDLRAHSQPACVLYVVPKAYPDTAANTSALRDVIPYRTIRKAVTREQGISFVDACMHTSETCDRAVLSASRAFAICAVGEDAIQKSLPRVLLSLEYLNNILRWRRDISVNRDTLLPLLQSKPATSTTVTVTAKLRQPPDVWGLTNRDVYAASGVNIQAGNHAVASIQSLVKDTYTGGVVNFPGGFGGVFRVSDDLMLVSSTDSVGSKSVFNDCIFASLHESLVNSGISIVNHCVNDILAMGCTTPLFFLDYFATDSLTSAPDALRYFIEGVADACRAAGCALIGGETAEIKHIYQSNTRDLVGFIVGQVRESELLRPKETLCVGDVCIALPSVSAHTNGFTLLNELWRKKYNASTTAQKENLDWLRSLARPHKSYLDEIRLLHNQRIPFKALIHITGGGLIDNPPRILPDTGALNIAFSRGVIDGNMPEMFKRLWRESGIQPHDYRQFYRIYNCGIGLVIVANPQAVESITEHLPGSFVVGRVVQGDLSGSPRSVFEQ